MNGRLASAALALSATLLGGCASAATLGPSPTPATFTRGPAATTISTPGPAQTLQSTAEPTVVVPVASSNACPSPATVADIAGLPGTPIIDHLLSCFGHSDITVSGYLGAPEGIGGTSNGITPSWLGEWSGLTVVLALQPFSADGCREEDSCPWTFVFSRKPAVLALTPARWVRVTGHFDDPAAATCRAAPGGDGVSGPRTDADAIAICRGHFVLTKIETIAAPS
jgi:hypothetical protein